jgi:hypothetical protein
VTTISPLRKLTKFLAVLLFVIPATAISTHAQCALTQVNAGQQLATANSATPNLKVAVVSPAMQTVIGALASLPEADTLVYVNPQRIFNEVLPRLMSPAEIEKMRMGFEEVKKSGFDPTKVDYVVFAIRFKKPTADLNFQPPEFILVSSGDFSAEGLIGLARAATQGKLREEKYGDKTLGLMTIDPVAKEAEKNPILKSFSEVGIVALNGNTLATGTPGYLRAAIDAGGGKGRIDAATLNSLVRDPNAIISFAGRPWNSFAKSFGMMGTDANARTPRCEQSMGDFYAALTMDQTNFMIRGVSNADNPDTARILANLYTMLLRYATSQIKDAAAQSVLNGLAITAEGDEVMMRADISQQMVSDLIKQQMKPKASEAAVSKPDVQPVVTKKRRSSRRRH